LKKIALKKITLIFLSVFLLFFLSGCGGNGDSNDSFYINGKVNLPEELNLNYEDVYISVIDLGTDTVGDIISVDDSGNFGFTVSRRVKLQPGINATVDGYSFNPSDIIVRKEKTINFDLTDKIENPIDLTSSVNSIYDEVEGAEIFELTLENNGDLISLQDLIDNPKVNLDLTESFIKITDINDNIYPISLNLLNDDFNSHSLNLENNTLTLNIEEYAQEILNNSSLDVNLLTREEISGFNEVVINLKSYKEDGELLFKKEIGSKLSEDGLFELLTQTYSKMGAFEINSSYIDNNVLDLINEVPVYSTTDISIELNNEASIISTDTSVIDNSGVIVSSGETDLSVKITSDTGREFQDTIKVIIN